MTSKVEMVSIVIPTLNEAGSIGEALTTLDKAITYPKEIIVVDGNSTDGTIEIAKDSNCRLIIEPKRGYGVALRTGMRNAKGNIVIMVDGDGTYEFKHVNMLVDKMIETDADLCLATRMYDKGKCMGMMNFVGNKLLTFCFNMLYKQNLSDSQSGFRAISHAAIEKVEFGETDMAFATEMLIKFAKKGFKMVEVPTEYKVRKYGKTKLKKFRSTIEILAAMLKGLRA
ncbi:MAG: glycosyltransferase family 2 protein [Candidatus Bathyarchaeia archaeon]